MPERVWSATAVFGSRCNGGRLQACHIKKRAGLLQYAELLQ